MVVPGNGWMSACGMLLMYLLIEAVSIAIRSVIKITLTYFSHTYHSVFHIHIQFLTFKTTIYHIRNVESTKLLRRVIVKLTY